MNVLALALVVAFLWGVLVIVQKYALTRVSPLMTMVLTSGVYLVCLGVYAAMSWKHLVAESAKLSWELVALIALAAVMCIFVANLIYYDILKRRESYVVMALCSSAPLFTLVLAWLLLKETIPWMGVVGVVLIVAGVVCLGYAEHLRE